MEHNTLTHAHRYTTMHQYQLKVASVPCRPSATHVRHCRAHLPAEQTHPLDWKNRIKTGAGIATAAPLPPSRTLCPTSPSKSYPTSMPKNFCSDALELFLSEIYKITTVVVSTAPYTTVVVRKTHTENNQTKYLCRLLNNTSSVSLKKRDSLFMHEKEY